MKLFLASRASDSLDLVLPLLPAAPHKLKLAFITTAADPYPTDNRPWYDLDRTKVVSMGFVTTNYDLKNKTPEVLAKDLSVYDVIYVEGGNTFYLLYHAIKSDFAEALKHLLEGKVYVGSSAGSALLGPSLDYLITIDHPDQVPELTDFTALGFIPERLVPHYDQEKYRERYEKLDAVWGDTVTRLRNDQALIVDGAKKYIVTV